MNKQHDDYKMVLYPKLRRALALTLRSAKRKPMIHGLIEVDVTKAREFLQEPKAKNGEPLSFTAFIITCLAKAVDKNKSLQAYRKGSKHLLMFDDVDVATVIEREMAEQKQPIVYIIRAANNTNSQSVVERMVASLVFIPSPNLFFNKLRPILQHINRTATCVWKLLPRRSCLSRALFTVLATSLRLERRQRDRP